MSFTFEEYQDGTAETAIYPAERGLEYTVLGLANEAGEVAGIYKKVLRDNDGILNDEVIRKLDKELGDVLWYLSQICNELGISMGGVAFRNLDKLQDRQKRGVLGGSGDDR